MKSMFALAFVLLSHVSLADMYVQHAPGSNNRLDEANRDRNNGNRCFDSQNNNRGGYNVGKLNYYLGEAVEYAWTNQHSSGKYQMGHTEIVIQGMCEPQVRDGTSTRTPPDAPTQCINFDCDNDVRYCRHESYESYQYCKATYRNMGLFTANQNLRGNRLAARNTRQNPAGTRRGYECPEERDYYPYWRTSQWFDIAYINADEQRCGEVLANSDNVKGKGYCKYNDEYWREKLYQRKNSAELPINQSACDGSTLSFVNAAGTSVKRFNWVSTPSHNLSAPACPGAIATSRANHHGLVQNTNEMMRYTWVIPNGDLAGTPANDADFFRARVSNPTDPSKPDYQCVLRFRYNITTDDYQAWASPSSIGAGLDYMNNTKRPNNQAPNADQDPARVAIWEKYGLTYNDVWCSFINRNPDSAEQTYCRAYVFRNNPRVDPWGLNLVPGTNSTSVQLQLAINTNQFGRTFQDRTHTFYILDRPTTGMQGEAIALDEPIESVMCRGKRGNIVQVYPATEYFYHKEGGQLASAKFQEGQVLHFQCAGSNTNPNNNDGQGKQGTDRTNFCPMTDDNYGGAAADPAGYRAYCAQAGVSCSGNPANSYAKRLTNEPYQSVLMWAGPNQNMYANPRSVFDASKSGLSYNVWRELCMNRQWLDPNQDQGNMEELDDAAADWSFAPTKLGRALQANGGATEVRTAYLCTRNNNFSNRSQKGTLTISEDSSTTNAMVSASGGEFFAATGVGGIVIVPPGAATSAMPVSFSTNEVQCSMDVTFDTSLLAPGGWIQLLIPCEPQALHKPQVMKQNGATWDTASTTPKKGFRNGKYMTVVSVTAPGTYRVLYVIDGLAIAAVVAGCLCFCCALGGALFSRAK